MPKATAPPTAQRDALAAKSEKSLQMSGLLAKIKDPAEGGAQKQFSNKERAQLSQPSDAVLSDAFDDFRPSPKYCCGEKCPPGEDRKIWCGPKDAPVLCDTVK